MVSACMCKVQIPQIFAPNGRNRLAPTNTACSRYMYVRVYRSAPPRLSPDMTEHENTYKRQLLYCCGSGDIHSSWWVFPIQGVAKVPGW